jgi:hypothetical protein
MAQYTTGLHPQYIGNGVFEHKVALTAATGTTAGAVVAVANPLGVALIIVNAYLNITTAATTSTNTIDLGVAANATTTSDTLIDGTTTTAGLKNVGGTNGLVGRTWGTTEYVTGTASATLVGMVGTLNLVCIRA